MTIQPGLLTIPMIIMSIIGVMILLVVVLYLIARTRKKHDLLELDSPSESLLPFPQQVSGLGTADQTLDQARLELIREAYRQWLAGYILSDLEPGRAFLRDGVGKQGRKYQVRSTSLGQGLAMTLSILMGGDDLGARGRFDRLLAYALAHPAAPYDDLTSWESYPDAGLGVRAEADPHGEAWIILSLQAASRQWKREGRFKYPRAAELRLGALMAYVQGPGAETLPAFSLPAFAHRFQKAAPGFAWEGFKQSEIALDLDNLAAVITGGVLDVDNAAWGLLHYGLGELVRPSQTPKDRSLIVKNMLKCWDLPDGLGIEEETGLSSLARQACAAPLTAAWGAAEQKEYLWNVLTTARPNKRDSIGASLRLLALYTLNGNNWLFQRD